MYIVFKAAVSNVRILVLKIRGRERIARERYFMKAADEDVYVVEYSDGDASDKSYNDGQTQ